MKSHTRQHPEAQHTALVVLGPQGVLHPDSFPTFRSQALSPMEGFFLYDIFSAVVNLIVKAVKAIVDIIKKIVSFIATAIYQAIKLIGKIAAFVWEGAIDILTLGPLFRWKLTRGLMEGLDYLTGGLISGVRKTLMLPAKLMRGEKITRAELMDALSFVAKVAMVVFTGGSTLAVIGASTSFLKNGPLGQTALGRTLLDVASIVTGAALTGANVVNSLVTKGQEVLKGEAVSFAADKSGLSKTVLGNTVFNATTGLVTGQPLEEVVKSSVVTAAGGGEAAQLLVGAGSAAYSSESGGELEAIANYTQSTVEKKIAPVITIAEILEDPSKLEAYERQVATATEAAARTVSSTLSQDMKVEQAANEAAAQAAKEFDSAASNAVGVPAVQAINQVKPPSQYLDQGLTDISAAMKDPSLSNLNLPKPKLTLDEIVKFALKYLMPGKNFSDLNADEQQMIMTKLGEAYPGYTIPDFNFEFDLENARLKRKRRGQMMVAAAGAAAAFLVIKE